MVDEIKKCIRIGAVHTVNEAEQTARVKYMLYGGMLSAELSGCQKLTMRFFVSAHRMETETDT